MMALTDSEREYVLGQLDRDHIAEVARQVRAKLQAGETVEACYQPGDATWYALVFTPLFSLAPQPRTSLIGGTGGRAPSTFFSGAHTLVVYAQRSTWVGISHDFTPEWAAAELTDNLASAAAIAELFRAVFET